MSISLITNLKLCPFWLSHFHFLVILGIVVFSKELRLPALDADEAEVYNHCLPLGNRVTFDLCKFD